MLQLSLEEWEKLAKTKKLYLADLSVDFPYINGSRPFSNCFPIKTLKAKELIRCSDMKI